MAINRLLITGCTGGFCLALALLLHIGIHVYAVGRNESLLNELKTAHDIILLIVADVATEASRAEYINKSIQKSRYLLFTMRRLPTYCVSRIGAIIIA